MARELIPDEEWIAAIKNSTSIAATLRLLSMNTSGGNHKQVHAKIEEFGMDTSHWLGQVSNRGRMYPPRPIQHILIENSTYTSTYALRQKLVKAGLLKDECSRCGISDWQGVKLSLHLDHMNGVRSDNRLENLRLLCPNCHSLTDTYCGKNKGRTSKKLLPPHQCLDCGKIINRRWSRCLQCYRAATRTRQPQATPKQPRPKLPKPVPREPKPSIYKIEWPNLNDLIAEVEATSYLATARRLGVSDNAIRKHIRIHSRKPQVSTAGE